MRSPVHFDPLVWILSDGFHAEGPCITVPFVMLMRDGFAIAARNEESAEDSRLRPQRRPSRLVRELSIVYGSQNRAGGKYSSMTR